MSISDGLESMYNGMRVVAIPMDKGGVGKTTCANLLAWFASSGYFPSVKKRVLGMDFDDQQNFSSLYLDMERVEGFYSRFPPIHPTFNPEDPEDVEWGGRSCSTDLYYGNPVEPYPTRLSNFEILPSDGLQIKSFEDAERTADQTLLEQITEKLAEWMREPDVQARYDMIILDCPPGKNLITAPILRACTDVILPTQMETFSIEGLLGVLADIKEANMNRRVPINIAGIVPNMVDYRLSMHKANLEALQSNPKTGPYVIKTALKSLSDFKLPATPIMTENASTLKKGSAAHRLALNFMDDICNSMYGESVCIPTKSKKTDKGRVA